MEELTLTSHAFQDGGDIPPQYTCDGEGKTPPLTFGNIPEGTKTLALIMDDPDIPEAVKESAGIDVFDHWVVFNIPAETNGVEEGGEPQGTLGQNSAGENGYTGPCPPGEHEPTKHRYVFRLYALDTELELAEGASKEAVEQAMEGHVLGKAQLTGMYERQ